MRATSLRASLLRAVLEDPFEDIHRLAYADWLEEFGDSEDSTRAEFIHSQMERHGLRCVNRVEGKNCTTYWCHQLRGECRHCDLWRREADLMLGLLAPVPRGQSRARLERGHDGPPELSWQLSLPGVGDLWFPVQFCRGFVDGIHLAMTDFLKHAEAIFSAHPVTRVVLSDRFPYDREMEGEGFAWRLSRRNRLGNRHVLPTRLHRQRHRLAIFKSQEEANEFLSNLCVAFGRDAAGLPPLTAPPPASGIPGRSGT